MNKWRVVVKIGDESEDTFELTDLKEITDSYMQLTRTYFDELISIAKMIKKYAIAKGIQSVKSPDNEDWTYNPWVLILFKDNEKGIPFWLLLKREKDLSGYLVATGPDNFVNFIQVNKDEDQIRNMMEYLVAYPQKFTVSIIIPNFIA